MLLLNILNGCVTTINWAKMSGDKKIKGGKKMRYAYYSERALEAIKKVDLKISE